jgi:hypothetical protein
MVFCKLRPAALEVHLVVPVIPDLHFIGSSSLECSQRTASRSSLPSMNLVNFSGTRWISRHWAPAMQKKEYILGEEGGEALRGGALGPEEVVEILILFLHPTGRPGRRSTGADDEATVAGSLDLFLLPRGRPRPRFSTGAPRFSCNPPALAMETNAGNKNPRWGEEEEDDAAEEDISERIRVFTLAKHALFISTS